MVTAMFSMQDVLALTPELFLLAATCVILLADLFIAQSRRIVMHVLSVAVLLMTAVLVWRASDTAGPPTAFGGMYLLDGLADLLKIFLLGVSALVLIYAKPYLQRQRLFSGEFYLLVLFAVLGMMLQVSSGNLLMLYLGLELMSLSSYALVALQRDSGTASEAAMKYFVLGALASGLLLYGISLLYGATGTLQLDELSAISAVGYERGLLAFGLVFVVVGVAFKLGVVPFHMWLPDVYEGSPTAVTLFIAAAPKVAAFGMLFRLLAGGLPAMGDNWTVMLGVLAVASMGLGNIFALAQQNLKRMLAYSTISHMGFLLMGMVAAQGSGYAAATFYAVTYALATAAAFGAMLALRRSGVEIERIDDLRGLNAQHPWIALLLLAVMASLTGIPGFVGFTAKVLVIKSALDAGMLWLAIAAVAFAVIGAFYYLRVIKVMYFDEPLEGSNFEVSDDRTLRVVLGTNGLALVALFLFGGPLLAWCLRAIPN
ncbi:MAG: NADH-quinone oxidoreductase subunit NuoN [Lysobacterales bacterium]